MLVEVDPQVVPDGYEAVRYGLPKQGEKFLHERSVNTAMFDFEKEGVLILRERPPVYREPTSEDVGSVVEMCSLDGSKGSHVRRTLLAVLPATQQFRFICDLGERQHEAYRWARIKVTE